MGDYARDSLDLDDEDRLPWLEPADFDDEPRGLSWLKLVAFIIAALALLSLVLFGIWYLREGRSGNGEGQLIAAPKGDYKVPARDADAKAFQGEGDATFPVSEGVEQDGRIDPSRLPEAPVTSGGATAEAAKGIAAPAKTVSAPVVNATGKAGGAAAPAAGTAASGPMIQLGAYGSEAVAKDAWRRLSKRFDYLAPLQTSVERAVVGSATYYRLRAAVPSNAEANILCGKLKVAGESCIVVR